MQITEVLYHKNSGFRIDLPRKQQNGQSVQGHKEINVFSLFEDWKNRYLTEPFHSAR